MDSLPTFHRYDEVEFDAWVQAYVAALRQQQDDDWRINNEATIKIVLRRAEEVRALLVSGWSVLRPMPPDGRLPSWANRLEPYLRYPGSGDGGARDSSSPSPPREKPRVFVVPGAPVTVQEPAVTEAKGEPGRPPLDDQKIRDQYAEILTAEAQGIQGDTALAKYLRCSETTIRRRRERGEKHLHQ